MPAIHVSCTRIASASNWPATISAWNAKRSHWRLRRRHRQRRHRQRRPFRRRHHNSRASSPATTTPATMGVATRPHPRSGRAARPYRFSRHRRRPEMRRTKRPHDVWPARFFKTQYFAQIQAHHPHLSIRPVGDACAQPNEPCAGLAHSECLHEQCRCRRGYYAGTGGVCMAEIGEVAAAAHLCSGDGMNVAGRCFCRHNDYARPHLRSCIPREWNLLFFCNELGD